MATGKGKFKGWHDWTGYLAEQGEELAAQVRRLTLKDMVALSRPGFQVTVYPNPQEFFNAEALEYVRAWQRATADNPVGVCGPIGPIEQLKLVAAMINDLGIDVRNGHFAGMDEFFDVETGRAIGLNHPLSFAAADLGLCFNRLKSELRMPNAHLHFPTEKFEPYTAVWDDAGIEWDLVQGGQGDTKHIAFNDPEQAIGAYTFTPPTVQQYAALRTRIVELHPATLIQDARHSNGGEVSQIPSHAITVGMYEILNRAKCISIWHPGHHDGPFGVRLTTFMISQKLVDARVPMSLLALHPNVKFNFLGPAIADAGIDVH